MDLIEPAIVNREKLIVQLRTGIKRVKSTNIKLPMQNSYEVFELNLLVMYIQSNECV